MKKLLLLSITLILALAVFCSCSDNNTENPSDTKDQEQTETPESKEELPASSPVPRGAKYMKFAAPTQDPTQYRQITVDYMMKMFNVTWSPVKNFTITWKEKGDFNVSLTYQKNKVYNGLPYSKGHSTLDQFTMLLTDDNKYEFSNYYYEETVGNHCASSMIFAYQQLVDMPITGLLKPSNTKTSLIFPEGVKKPDNDSYTSGAVLKLNGKDKIFEAYASLDAGDILYKCPTGSGHTRMVHNVNISKNASGEVNYARSYIETIEATNQFDSTRKDGINTTWWIDHRYTFEDLYKNEFMPVTLAVFQTGAKLQDAYIWFDGKNSPETILNGIDGTVSSNFTLNFVRMTMTNSKGEIVKDLFSRQLNNSYTVNFKKNTLSLKLNELPPDTYTYKLVAGIGRGMWEIESFEFTVK